MDICLEVRVGLVSHDVHSVEKGSMDACEESLVGGSNLDFHVQAYGGLFEQRATQ